LEPVYRSLVVTKQQLVFYYTPTIILPHCLLHWKWKAGAKDEVSGEILFSKVFQYAQILVFCCFMVDS